MLIDTHAHLNFNAFKDDADEVIRRSLAGGVQIINVGSQYSTSKRAVEMAEGVYPHTKFGVGVYAAVGLHPIHLREGIFRAKLDTEEIAFQTENERFDYEKYKQLAESEKVVAIGECGLDYFHKPYSAEKQKEVLVRQLELAKELNLPVIFHCRAAHEDLIKILEHYNNGTIRGVIHCFTGTWQEAQKYLDKGLYLGFNGIIFKLDLDEVIKKAPLGKILLETDCPYLTPKPMEGRNEPLYVKYIAEKIAQLKNITPEELAEMTTQNTKKLFGI